MTKAMENAAWHKGKRPLVDEYIQNAKQVEAIVSGRGHLYRPGFLGDGITQVERGLKFKLSDLNYAITKESIERELAQTGHDYDIAYKNAAIAWELEKAQLLTALEEEFADNKNVRAMDNFDFDQLEITTHLRKYVIMAAKLVIDLDMETERQNILLADKSTFYAEDVWLAAKIRTAERKLDVIPYIEAVLAKQQDIIDAELGNADRKEALITEKENLNDKRIELISEKELIAAAIVTLIAAKQALVEKRAGLITAKELVSDQEIINVGYLQSYISALSGLSDVQQDLVAAKNALIPKINEKSTALIAYTAELDAWVVIKNAIAGVKEDIATEMEARVGKKGDIIGAKVDLNNLKLALQEAQISLEIARMTGKSNLMTQKIGNAAEILTERQAAFDSKIFRESELLSGQIDLDLYESQIAFETMEESNDIEIPARVQSLTRIVLARINEREGTASAAANARLTSQLVHELS